MFRHVASAVSGYILWPGLVSSASAQSRGSNGRTQADNVIFVLLSGGISQTDTFDFREGPWTPSNFEPEETLGFRWPRRLLPKLAEQLPSVTLVRSVLAWAEDHALAREWLQIGRNPTRPDSVSSPHIGSVIASELGANQPDAVFPPYMSLNAVSGNQPESGFLPVTYSPLMVNNVNGESPNWTRHPDGADRFQKRVQLLNSMETEHSSSRVFDEIATNQANARRLMGDARVDQAFQLSAGERQEYGESSFGNACLVARNMLRHKLGPRFIQITYGDWDHHGQIYNPAFLSADEPTSMARRLDSGLGSLISDLRNDGLLDRTLILVMGEFGRTVGALSSAAGRDHLRTQSVLFAGASIRGGHVIGSTDETGRVIEDFGWRGNRPIRHEDIEATLYSALEIDWTKTIVNPVTGGRYLYVPGSDEQAYMPLTELWAGATRESSRRRQPLI
jgi:hypothetical protein